MNKEFALQVLRDELALAQTRGGNKPTALIALISLIESSPDGTVRLRDYMAATDNTRDTATRLINTWRARIKKAGGSTRSDIYYEF